MQHCSDWECFWYSLISHFQCVANFLILFLSFPWCQHFLISVILPISYIKIVVISSPRASSVSIFDIFISFLPFSPYQHSQIFLMSVFSDIRKTTFLNHYCPVSHIPDIVFTLNTLTLKISVGAFLDSISWYQCLYFLYFLTSVLREAVKNYLADFFR